MAELPSPSRSYPSLTRASTRHGAGIDTRFTARHDKVVASLNVTCRGDEAVAEALGLNSRFRPVADIWAAGSGSQAPALATQVRLRERETPDLLGSRAQLPLYLKTDGSGYG